MMMCLICPVIGYAEAQKITLVSSEYPPYFGVKLANYGGLGEIIVAAFQRVGYEVTIKFYPWARAIQMTKDGDCDGMFALWFTQEREQWFVFSDPLPANEIGFYKRTADPIHFTTLEELKPYRIGTVRGYANPSAFEQATYLQKEEVTQDLQNLKKLVANHIDLALIDKGLAAYLLTTALPEARDTVEWLEPALEIMPQYVVMSKQVAAYQQKIEDFNRGLAQITQDGLVENIRAKHGF
ncbi:MAG: hypothetical protein A2277_14215 [Desulfobacterales bacterium RIFOXYA12_FULL_46_15]|nr:MAG: hypothetical protein A2097_01725 [Desulfobacula sp. GWF2_41_7]OGR26846.1 MAG: hypothetical protein A2277_14215 [Desulfobacterales bacterium RIFOXYA12_FULL_46_15]